MSGSSAPPNRRRLWRAFFATPRHGPQTQPQKTAARDTIVALRKQNYSVYEISETLQDQGTRLSPTGVREVLKAARGDLGRSVQTNRPVIQEITDRLPNTIILAISSMTLAVIFGITLNPAAVASGR